MNNISKKIPLVTYLYIVSCVYRIINLIISVSQVSNNNTGSVSITPIIITLIFDIAVIALLFRNKKDMPLFAVFTIMSARTLISVITNFSIWGIINCIASLILVFIVGTAVLPQLSAYQDKAKKFFFVPSLLVLAVSIFSNIGQLQYITLTLPISTFMIYVMPFVTNFFFASWCVKSQEDNAVGSKKEKGLFKIIAIVLVICAALSYFMEFRYTSPSDKSWSELEDWEKDNARWAYHAQQAIDDYEK